MKKIITFFIAALTFCSIAFAQNEKQKQSLSKNDKVQITKGDPTKTEAVKVDDPKSVNPNSPKIKFQNEAHDFGTVVEGPSITYDFKFKNEGKEPLILSSVRASCGCTVPTWPKEPILPGKESVISATYNTQGRPGSFTKSITVESNASEASKIVTIKGEVIKPEEDKSIPLARPSLLSPKN